MNGPFVAWLCVHALALVLTACDRPKPCVATEVVRVSINRIDYNIPIDLRPKFFGGSASDLRFGEVRAGDGRWAYCQSPSDGRIDVDSFSPFDNWDFWKTYPELIHVTFIWLEGRPLPNHGNLGADWPATRLSGYEIFYNKENSYIFKYKDEKPDVSGYCSLKGDMFDRCRLSFLEDHGTLITVDLRGLHVDQWDEKLLAVKRFIRNFEVTQ